VDHALFGADPAELAVVDEVPPCLAPVGDEAGEGPALYALGYVVDGGAYDVVAAADGKGLGFVLAGGGRAWFEGLGW
jgi:hypothetical protein